MDTDHRDFKVDYVTESVKAASRFTINKVQFNGISMKMNRVVAMQIKKDIILKALKEAEGSYIKVVFDSNAANGRIYFDSDE